MGLFLLSEVPLYLRMQGFEASEVNSLEPFMYRVTSLIRNCHPHTHRRAHGPTVASYGVVVSYERGTRAAAALELQEGDAAAAKQRAMCLSAFLQGYLAHKKPRPLRTLQ